MAQPKKGELVVIRIKRLTDTGAYAKLLEYDKKGFIHISNVSSSWVKNIRSHLTKGEVKVAQAIRINKGKDLTDLSLQKVSKKHEKAKLDEWKKSKRAGKLVEIAAKRADKKPEEIRQKLGKNLYELLEKTTIKGKKALDGTSLNKKTKKEIVKIAGENIKKPEVNITAKLILKVPGENGVKKIKKILKKSPDKDIKITYVSSPKYKVKITARDYKKAEKKLSKLKENVSELAEKHGAECSFKRKQK